MLDFFADNIGTIIVAVVVAAIVGAIIYKLLKDKKRGKSSFGCNCGFFQNSSLCHAHSKKGDK